MKRFWKWVLALAQRKLNRKDEIELMKKDIELLTGSMRETRFVTVPVYNVDSADYKVSILSVAKNDEFMCYLMRKRELIYGMVAGNGDAAIRSIGAAQAITAILSDLYDCKAKAAANV
jgi:hypothetical protein